MTKPFVESINAEGGNVAVAQNVFGDIIFSQAERPVSDYIIPFDLENLAQGFVGRAELFTRIAGFEDRHARGYVEIVGDAGLGKTALAAEFARRRQAIAFLCSASRGTQRAAQFLRHVSAALITGRGVPRKVLPATVADNATTLTQLMREAVAERPADPVWIVVDGLDEAESATPGANPLLLPPDLPQGVYVLVTWRGGSLFTDPGTPLERIALVHDAPEQVADIDTFVHREAAVNERLATALAAAVPALSVSAFAEAVTRASAGNFMYVSYLLADVADARPGELDLGHLPERLVGYYDQLWERVSAAQQPDWETWERVHRPVLDRLAVAREAVSEHWLATHTGRPAAEIRSRVLAPWQRVLTRVARGGTPSWRVLHHSFAEYLLESGKVSAIDAHAAIARAYVDGRVGEIEDWDDYGVRHAATHLAEAADGVGEQEGRALISDLARLVADERLVRRQLVKGDVPLVERDLNRAMSLVVDVGPPGTFLLLVPIALTLVQLRGGMLQPDAIFTAAARGDAAGAERLLDLFAFDLDLEWRSALALLIGWIATDAAPNDARAMVVRTVAAIHDDWSRAPMLRLLVARMNAGNDGPDAPELPSLPDPPSVEEAQMMVDRLAGSGMHSSLQFDRREGYLSATDGPQLVALAAKRPEVGDPLLERYIELHGAYGYKQYRDASLWRLIPPILAHSDPAWVRQALSRVGAALMAPSRGAFLDGLQVSTLTAKALIGDAAAAATVAELRRDALTTAAALPAGSGTASASYGGPEKGDAWAKHRRRLAALAESSARLGAEPATGRALIDAANRIHGGFAGFTAHAFLTLAEAAWIAGADGEPLDWVRWSLEYATNAAHNIRDPVYCPRVTARVAAMRTQWWPGPDPAQLATTVADFQADPLGARFSPLHVVGESFTRRTGCGSAEGDTQCEDAESARGYLCEAVGRIRAAQPAVST